MDHSRSHVTKITREWSFQLPQNGLEEDSIKPI